MSKLLRHYPNKNIEVNHDNRDYFIIAFSFIAVALCFLIDSVASIELQHALGIAGWASLLALLYGECKYVRTQVLIAVTFATIGENFASIFMAGYTYRLENVPAFTLTPRSISSLFPSRGPSACTTPWAGAWAT